MQHDVPVTIRIGADVHDRIQAIAREHGISQNAVWKILITQHVRPALTGQLLPPSAIPASPADHH